LGKTRGGAISGEKKERRGGAETGKKVCLKAKETDKESKRSELRCQGGKAFKAGNKKKKKETCRETDPFGGLLKT